MRLAGLLGDQDTALAAAQKWLDELPSDPRRTIAVINALDAVAKHDEASRLSRSLQAHPIAAANGFLLEGVHLAQRGDLNEAQKLFRRALSLQPEQGSAWEQITLLNAYEDQASDLQEMLSLTKRIKSTEQLIPLFYALGRAYDYLNDTDKAFHFFSAGAAMRNKAAPFNLPWLLGYVERLQQSFTAEYVRKQQLDAGGEYLIFMLSAARSGSTLLEQILATAPEVTPAGEHSLMRLATLRLGAFEPHNIAHTNDFKETDWQGMAQIYHSRLQRRFGISNFYTDKTVINHFYAGVARIMFPNAKMIWCKRDPRDVVWSCFRSHITDNRWAQDLDTCAQFILAHNRLCEHWSEIFGDGLLEVSYESLVDDPDNATDTLFEHVRVSRPDDWRQFHQNKNTVSTASVAQVRQPMSNSSVGAWKRYEKHLAPIYDTHF